MQYRGIYYHIHSNPDGSFADQSGRKTTVILGSGAPADNLCHGTIYWPTEQDVTTDTFHCTMPLVASVPEVEKEMDAKLRRCIDAYLDNERLRIADKLGAGKEVLRIVE